MATLTGSSVTGDTTMASARPLPPITSDRTDWSIWKMGPEVNRVIIISHAWKAVIPARNAAASSLKRMAWDRSDRQCCAERCCGAGPAAAPGGATLAAAGGGAAAYED